MPRRTDLKYQIDRRRSKSKTNHHHHPAGSDDDDDDDANNDNNKKHRNVGPYHTSDEEESDADDSSEEEAVLNEDSENEAKPRKKPAAKSPSKPRGRPPNKQTTKPKPKPKPNKPPSSEEEEEESASEPEWPEEKDDPDDEDFVPTSSSSKAAAGRRKRKAAVNNNSNSSSSEEEDFAADDDDEEALEEYKPAAARGNKNNRKKAAAKPAKQKKPRGRPVKKQRQRQAQDSDDDDDDDDLFDAELDDDDEEVIAASPSRTNRRKGKPPATGRRRTAAKEDSDDDVDVDDDDDLDAELDDDDEEVIGNSPSRTTSRRRVSPRSAGRRPAVKDDSDSDDDDADEEEETSRPAPVPARSRRASSTLRPKSYKEVDSSDDEGSSEGKEDEDEQPSRPRRVAASRATNKMEELRDSLHENENENEDEEDDEEEDQDERDSKLEKHHASPSKQLSSDEEFLADSASENSDDKQIVYTDSEDDDDDDDDEADEDGPPLEKKAKPVNIDNEDIGNADDSSDDDNAGDGAQGVARAKQTPDTPASKLSQFDEIRPSPHKLSIEDGDSDDSDGKLYHTPPTLPDCPSLEDAITAEPLPKIHVCCISPDGQSRQCFAIETLRQIALKSAHLPFRVDLDGSAQDTFLQPPHFRTAMSDDMLDQIASRFGRGALNLHGEFYSRNPKNFLLRDGFEDDYENVFGSADREEIGEDFVDRVQRYMNNQMGSRDAYACPLCYSEMHRRIVQMDRKPIRSRNNNDDDDDGESADDEEFLELPADSSYDPMTVLGWLDNDKFEAASCFCFGKVANLKKHLRNDHTVQTNGVQGNDLYQRFRIRGQDGLLQRFLHNHWKRMKCTTYQGAMAKYWFEGNNQSFVYLLCMMDRAQLFREIIQAGDIEDEDYEKAEAYFEVGNTFFRSFQSRAQLEWEHVSSPFLRTAQKDDLKDFLVEGEDDPPDESPHFLAHRQFLQQEEDSDPNDLVHKLERKYAQNEEGGSSIEEDDLSNESGDEDEEVVSITSDLNWNGYYSEEEEEKDEWVDSIRNKKKMKRSPAASKPKASPPVAEATPIGRKLTRRKSTTPSSPAAAVSLPTPASLKRRSIAEDSSSDEGFDEGVDA